MLKTVFIVLSTTVLFDLHQGVQLDYDELKALGGSCPLTDTCSVKRTVEEDNLFRNTCECKPSCRQYGTCCIDSPNNQPGNPLAKRTWPDTHEESCMYLMGVFKSLVVKHKCRQGWRQDSEVKSLCETSVYSTNFEDPVAALPVTNPKTSTTYKNYFCALCNDDTEDLVFWNANVTKYIPTSSYAEEERRYKDNRDDPNLTFDKNTHQWGSTVSIKRDKEDDVESAEINEEVKSSPHTFSGVSIIFTYPPSLSESIISCSTDLISDCHPNWKDELVKEKCHSYMAMIYGNMMDASGYRNFRRFRNVHCAICNNVGNVEDLTCFFAGSGGPADGDTMSFSWLLDINPSDGDRVGEINRCSSGEVYDPFFKKCRVMKCVKPGYKVVKGKCKPS